MVCVKRFFPPFSFFYRIYTDFCSFICFCYFLKLFSLFLLRKNYISNSFPSILCLTVVIKWFHLNSYTSLVFSSQTSRPTQTLNLLVCQIKVSALSLFESLLLSRNKMASLLILLLPCFCGAKLRERGAARLNGTKSIHKMPPAAVMRSVCDLREPQITIM